MKRTLSAEEQRLWSRVAATIRPAPGRSLPSAPAEPAPTPDPAAPPARVQPPVLHRPKRAAPAPSPPPEAIEPGRKRRLVRERDPIDGRIDLHGMSFDDARAALHAYLRRSAAEGRRAVLVITGKGVEGDGLLRRWTPTWLAEPAVRDLVAGISPAARRHGGEGALYVALKRQPT